MTRILLIRHGNTDLLHEYLCGRTPGISLNQGGRDQALNLAQYLFEKRQLGAVYSGPLERAMETAHLVALPQSLSVTVDEGINELDFGTWVGAKFSDLDANPEWQEYNRTRSLTAAPEGESLLDVQERASKSLRALAAAHQDETVAVVTHGDVIRAVLMLLLGMPLDHILRLEINPASVSEISMGSGLPVVHGVNQIFSI